MIYTPREENEYKVNVDVNFNLTLNKEGHEMRIIKAETPEWMKPKKKHKPSLLIKPDPIEIGTCPLCHREITDIQKGTRLEGTDFVYENKRVLCHKECGRRKKLGNTTRQEAKRLKKRAEKKRKPYKKKK